jgi:hypothetical protein
MLLSQHPMNMTLMCSLTYCYLQSCMDSKFCSYKSRRSSEAWQSWEKILVDKPDWNYITTKRLKNYILWQTWKEAPIFLTGRIGVDKRLAKETTFDNLRFLLFSCSGGKDMSNEHTLTASLILLLRFLCNNAVNYIHLSQPRKTVTETITVKCWKQSNMTIKGAHRLHNMQETADVTFL